MLAKLPFTGRLINSLVFAILISNICGCVSPDASKQIKSFSEATILTADNTTQAFKLVEDTYYNEQVSRLIFNSGDQKRLEAFHLDSLHPFIDTNALQVRLDILEALKTYAANLSALMGNSSLTNLDQDTAQLGKVLITIDTNLVSDLKLHKEVFTTGEIQIFTAAINAMGHWLISYKQEKDAKTAIASMQQPVADICSLFQKDFPILRDQLTNNLFLTFSQDRAYLIDHNAQFDNAPEQKRAAVGELAALAQDYNADLLIFDSMPSATAKLAAAQLSLAEVFSRNKTGNISSLIKDFSAEAERITKYYRSLKTNK